MRPITPTPEDYKEIEIYKRLRLLDGQKNTGLVSKVDTLISEVTPLLETIGREGVFANYTLHNPVHSRKLMNIARYVIPNETWNSLSQLELTIMIMSFYVHDLGMVVMYNEKEKILQTDEFRDFISSNSEFEEKINNLKNEIKCCNDELYKDSLQNCLQEVYDAALTEYIRPIHASRERYDKVLKLIKDSHSDIFEFNGNFEDDLLRICSSHNELAKKLIEKDEEGSNIFRTDLYFGDQRLNVQYCAAVLRIVDILDFDRERTPRILYKAIGIEDINLPGFKISVAEWNKQMSILSVVFDDEKDIIVNAESTSPNIEKALAQMCDWVEREIRDTTSFINSEAKDVSEIYHFHLPLIVKLKTKRRGYVYKDYSIHLNEDSIINLLMGDNLYEKAQVAVRELLQNSIDACKVRSKLKEYGYYPTIEMYIQKRNDGRSWLVVKDNGIGMDNNVLSKYFFKVGNSYYQSSDFKQYSREKNIDGFTPISRFGIGLLSVFMIGDTLKVTTRNINSSTNDKKLRTLIVDNTDSLAVVSESEEGGAGTKIELRLKRDKDNEIFINSIFGYVRENFIRPEIPIKLKYPDNKEIDINNDRYIDFKPNVSEILSKNNIESWKFDLSKYSSVLKGYAFFIFFKNKDGRLSVIDESGINKWGYDILKPSELFDSLGASSRLTVNGILIRMKKIGSLFNIKGRPMPCVFDVDVIGGEDVRYDVSRSKIISDGLNFVRYELITALDKAMDANNVFSRLDSITRIQYGRNSLRRSPSKPLDKKLLSVVAGMIPDHINKYSKDLLELIQEKINLNPTELAHYIYAVIDIRGKGSVK